MSPWLLLVVIGATLYIGGGMLRMIFNCIDRAHEQQRAAQASPREGAQHTRERG